MIVIDNFIKDENILNSFCNVDLWNTLSELRYENWYGEEDLNHEAALHNYISYLRETFWKDTEFNRLEYWANITNKIKGLDWHFDKDETLSKTTGEIKTPVTGAIWYGYPHKVAGGYLEIATDEAQLERLKPVYNRLVLFDVAKVHRVSPILYGTRYGLQVNLW